MKALELKSLMIGDWVSPLGLPDIKLQVNPEDFVNLREFEPVPLTDDILKKNGFRYHAGERGMYGVVTSPYYDIEDSPRIFCDGDPFSVWFEEEVPIRYVHQLQHVLRLCEINKEIEL